MWNKRNDEEPPSRTTPTPAPVRPVGAPAAPPAGEAKAANRGGVMGPSMTVKGEIHSREELYVDGEIQGSIELQHRLTVGPNGKIRATVKAKEVVVFGSIQGNVQASEKIIIREKGSLVGDIKTAGIVIEDGAYFKGSIDITRAESNPRGAAGEMIASTADKAS
jgi:cytoskeletal protein CcmA (bactofilin family)